MGSAYRDDLAWIHERGFGWYALQSAPGLLRLLRNSGHDTGTVVDLGCGNGIWQRQLGFAGYQAVGIDSSTAMIRLARKTAPRAEFSVADLTAAPIPKCDAVTSLGEVLSYAWADDADGRTMRALFRRVFRALRPGGIFIFDFAAIGRESGGMPHKGHWTGDGWAVLVDSVEVDSLLTRTITSFRKRGRTWRRSVETHTLRLFRPSEIAAELAAAGFQPKQLRGFGDVRFQSGHAGFLARKPG